MMVILGFQSTLPVWGATFRPSASMVFSIFQSTLPVWGATLSCVSYLVALKFQSTLPVWGATHGGFLSGRCFTYFNPRSPYGERRFSMPNTTASLKFQSTLPVWGATLSPRGVRPNWDISIHAPRMGSDDFVEHIVTRLGHFNPRSPYGERQRQLLRRCPLQDFNPRSPYGERPSSPST